MDIRHMSMFVLGERMLVLVRVSNIVFVMGMKFIVTVSMFVNNGHMNMKMGVFFICQQ